MHLQTFLKIPFRGEVTHRTILISLLFQLNSTSNQHADLLSNQDFYTVASCVNMTINEDLRFNSLGGLISRSPAIPSVTILFIVASAIVYLLSRPKRLNLPVMGKRGQKYYGNDVLEGASKVRPMYDLSLPHADIDVANSTQLLPLSFH